jgi:hypothetical protein
MSRSLWMAVVIAVLVICAYAIGLPYGPKGVAAAYSTVMALWLVPHLVWCVHGTVIRPVDLARAAGRPLAAGLVAALVCVGLQFSMGVSLSVVPRLAVGLAVLGVTYAGILLIVFRQLAFYNDLLKTVLVRPASPAAS